MVVFGLQGLLRLLQRQTHWLAVNLPTMSCHVDGLKMGFTPLIALAKEISKDRKDHVDEFKKAFKMTIQQQALNSASNKNWKQKRNCIDTYNDLNDNNFIVKNEGESDNDSNNEWVTKNEFYI
jgi:hypothetical protein